MRVELRPLRHAVDVLRDGLARQRAELVPAPAQRLVDLAGDREAPVLERRVRRRAGREHREVGRHVLARAALVPPDRARSGDGGIRGTRTTWRPPLRGSLRDCRRPYAEDMRALFVTMIAGAAMLGGHAAAAVPQRIVFESGDTIHEVDLSGLHRRILIPGHFQADAIKGLAALPDGSLVIGVNERLVRYDAHGKRVADLGVGQLPTASPDGSRLAFGVYDPRLGQARIWLMNADGSGRRQLTSGALDGAPAWSPDGKTILFTRSVRNALTAGVPSTWLETIPVGGGTPKRLTTSGLDGGGRSTPRTDAGSRSNPSATRSSRTVAAGSATSHSST